MSGPVKLVTNRDTHRENAIELLRDLLADAEAGNLLALTGVAEYATEYRDIHSGCRNVYSMAGAHMRAVAMLTKDQ